MLLPHFLCIGAPKCGTTWLFNCLYEHPDIFIPDEKEIHFFDIVGVDIFKTKGIKWYANFYKNSLPNQTRGDITPYYMREDYVPERIKQVLPQCKMIVLLRNPIERAYSDYWMLVGKGLVNYEFEDLVFNYGNDPHLILRTGLYAQHLERFFAHFHRENFLILLTDDIKQKPALILHQIFEFIGVTSSFKPSLTMSKSNQAFELRSPQLYHLNYKIARTLNLKNLDWIRRVVKKTGISGLVRRFNRVERQYPPLTEKNRIELIEFYRKDIKRLAIILDRNLDHWLSIDSKH